MVRPGKRLPGLCRNTCLGSGPTWLSVWSAALNSSPGPMAGSRKSPAVAGAGNSRRPVHGGTVTARCAQRLALSAAVLSCSQWRRAVRAGSVLANAKPGARTGRRIAGDSRSPRSQNGPALTAASRSSRPGAIRCTARQVPAATARRRRMRHARRPVRHQEHARSSSGSASSVVRISPPARRTRNGVRLSAGTGLTAGTLHGAAVPGSAPSHIPTGRFSSVTAGAAICAGRP